MAEDRKQITDSDLGVLFAKARREAQGQEGAESQAFLNSLAAIPDRHPQEQAQGAVAASAGWSLFRLIDAWFEPSRLLSARGLISQGAFAMVLLVSGIVTGLEMAEEPQVFDDFDVSAGLFGGEDEPFSLNGGAGGA